METQWQTNITRAIVKQHSHGSSHKELSYLLEEPRRKAHYTLDFARPIVYVRRQRRPRDSISSPLRLAIDIQCNGCLRRLLQAGASLNYCPLSLHTALSYFVIRHRDRYGESVEVRDMLEELLRPTYGADVNATETSASYSALAHAADGDCSSLLVQVLLEKGAQITSAAWHQAVTNIQDLSILYIFLDHCDQFKLVIPLHLLFEYLAVDWNGLFEDTSTFPHSRKLVLEEYKPSFQEKLKVIICRGYVPYIKCAHARRVFESALRENATEGDKVVFMILDKAPMMLQVCRGALQGVTLSPQVQGLLDTPPSLQNLCKGVVIATMGHGYVKKVQQLDLPKTIIEKLETVNETA